MTWGQGWLYTGLSQEESELKILLGLASEEGMSLPGPSYKQRQSKEHSRLWKMPSR